VNRSQRRRLAKSQRVVERTRADLQRDRARLAAEARDVAASLRTLDAPREERVALAERAIAAMATGPLTRLVSRDALAELRRVRDELAAV
jgi:hypothetical protein